MKYFVIIFQTKYDSCFHIKLNLALISNIFGSFSLISNLIITLINNNLLNHHTNCFES